MSEQDRNNETATADSSSNRSPFDVREYIDQAISYYPLDYLRVVKLLAVSLPLLYHGFYFDMVEVETRVGDFERSLGSIVIGTADGVSSTTLPLFLVPFTATALLLAVPFWPRTKSSWRYQFWGGAVLAGWFLMFSASAVLQSLIDPSNLGVTVLMTKGIPMSVAITSWDISEPLRTVVAKATSIHWFQSLTFLGGCFAHWIAFYRARIWVHEHYDLGQGQMED